MVATSNVHQPSGSIDAFDNLQAPDQPAMNPNRPRVQSSLPRHETPQVTSDDKIAGIQGAAPAFGAPPVAFIPNGGPAVPEPAAQTPPPPPTGVNSEPAVAVNNEPAVAVPEPATFSTQPTPPPTVPKAEPAVAVAAEPAVQQSRTLPVKARLESLEQANFNAIQSGTTLERVAKLELVLLGTSNSGTISARLSALETERVEIGRIAVLEQELSINSNQQGSPLTRIEVLELELWGANSSGLLSARLQKLEEEITDMERVVRLEQELEINPGRQGSRMDRIGSLEQALFGESYAGTTFLSRLVRLEAELLG